MDLEARRTLLCRLLLTNLLFSPVVLLLLYADYSVLGVLFAHTIVSTYNRGTNFTHQQSQFTLFIMSKTHPTPLQSTIAGEEREKRVEGIPVPSFPQEERAQHELEHDNAG